MSRKYTVILIIVIAAIVLALGIFLLFFTSPAIQNTTGPSSNSPFGSYNGSSSTTPITSADGNNSTASSSSDVQYINNPTSQLLKISTVPIAGAEVFDRKINATTSVSIVRYIERATGHTDEYNHSTGALSASSNTTIPSIYQAWWSSNTVLAQFIGQSKDLVKTFTGNLPASTSPATQLIGGFLSDNISTLAISPKGNRVFTIQKGDSALGYISNLDGSKKTSVLNFPFNEWVAQWPNENTITLTTKPSSGALGFMYFLTTGGAMTKALGNITGLTTLTNPSLSYTIYSSSQNGSISAGIYNFSKNTYQQFTSNPTLPEKCVWSKLNKTTAYCAVPTTIPSGNYPDDWYQGSVSFVDNIYKIDMSIPTVQLLYQLPTDQSIDAINLFLDAKEENLYFTNKSDYYLWGLTIKGL